MSLYDINDTICALSTAPGSGAIAVIRLSGPEAFLRCSRIFRATDPDFMWDTVVPYTIHHGFVYAEEQLIDEVLISLFKAPRSYTGEDVVEISCHGSEYIQQQILEVLVQNGCRLAKPGEFTLRAFLHGKFDLSQAEAVADLIASLSQSSRDLALAQMRGGFSKRIKELRQKLVHISSLIELELDFSEEDVEFASRTDFHLLLDEFETELTRLIRSFSFGNVIKKGIPVAIIGKPNVGKSTLLNTLLNEEKAIVSEVPGTTRDAIEDTIVLEGFRFRFIDTAGLRASEDQIEAMGIDRTWMKMEEASIILYLFDVTRDSYREVADAIAEFGDLLEEPSKRLILIGNKTDLLTELPHGFQQFVEHETLFVSAKRKENIHLVAESLLKTVTDHSIGEGSIVSNTRHLEALQKAQNAIQNIHEGLQSGLTPDLLAIDIRQALHHLGEITGEITNDEILGNIFSKFCIGK